MKLKSFAIYCGMMYICYMENLKLEIISNGMNGEGIAKHDGKVFFVENAVEGDLVLVKETKSNKNFSNAKIEKIELASKFRCNPKCGYYGKCGGCNLQHIEYLKQLEIKTQNVQNLFNKQKLNVKVLPCKESLQKYGYRNKLTMYLTKNKSLGFYEKNSKRLIDINRCELVDEKFNNLINKLNIFLKNNMEFNPLILKGISIREIDNNIFILNLILTKKMGLEKMENYLKLNKINYSLFYSINNSKDNNLPGNECFFVGGKSGVLGIEFDIKYPIYPLSFLQVNTQVKSEIYTRILELVDENMTVLDAYSGAGLLSSMISKKSKKVFAVEIEKSASKACEELCKINKIKNLVAICGDCEKEVPKITKDNKIDVVILDPARKGADEKTLNAVLNAKPKKIIYLSCNPATLTRDLKILCNTNEYNIDFALPYDMFPNTSEVETLVCLTNLNDKKQLTND